MTITDALKKIGIEVNPEDLTHAEMDTLTMWLDYMKSHEVTVPQIQVYIRELITGIEMEVADTEEFQTFLFFRWPNRKSIALRARLKNYLLLEAMVTSYSRAKEALEKQLLNIKNIPKENAL